MKGRLPANVSNKETEGSTHSNLAYIRNISNIAFHKESLKLNFFFISKFRFDLVPGKIFNDTHLKFIKINYVEDTEQQS